MKTAGIATALLFGMCLALLGACEGDEGGVPTREPSPAVTAEASPPPTRGATPELTPSPAAPTPTPAVWSDGRIGIAIEKVERLDAIPPEFPDTPLLHASYSPKDYRLSSVARGAEAGARPGEGYDYVAVYLNFARIEVELVRYSIIGSAFDWESQPSILIDTNGNRYEEQAFMARGVRFGDMSHLTGTYRFTEATTMVLIFELPEREEPATLKFVYPFSDSESRGWGQIDITLQG